MLRKFIGKINGEGSSSLTRSSTHTGSIANSSSLNTAQTQESGSGHVATNVEQINLDLDNIQDLLDTLASNVFTLQKKYSDPALYTVEQYQEILTEKITKLAAHIHSIEQPDGVRDLQKIVGPFARLLDEGENKKIRHDAHKLLKKLKNDLKAHKIASSKGMYATTKEQLIHNIKEKLQESMVFLQHEIYNREQNTPKIESKELQRQIEFFGELFYALTINATLVSDEFWREEEIFYNDVLQPILPSLRTPEEKHFYDNVLQSTLNALNIDSVVPQPESQAVSSSSNLNSVPSSPEDTSANAAKAVTTEHQSATQAHDFQPASTKWHHQRSKPILTAPKIEDSNPNRLRQVIKEELEQYNFMDDFTNAARLPIRQDLSKLFDHADVLPMAQTTTDPNILSESHNNNNHNGDAPAPGKNDDTYSSGSRPS